MHLNGIEEVNSSAKNRRKSTRDYHSPDEDLLEAKVGNSGRRVAFLEDIN